MTYILVKDHLEQAQAILDKNDAEGQKLQEVLQMVIGLIDELQLLAKHRASNIVDFPGRYRSQPSAME